MTIVSEHDIEELRFSLKNRLGEALLLTSQEDMLRYCRDWHGDVTSSAVAVIRPRSTKEVSDTVRACAELGLAIIPQGGNTGLVLGGIPDAPNRQVVLSLERMNAIRTIDSDDFSAVVEAGCILSEFKDAVQDKGMFFPLSLGAQGSCRIGGNVSTNAGGINVLRYGMTRELVLGLEVVLPDGTIWNGLSTLRKDNRGIDLKQLFIGAEGTLGIITAVAVKLYPNPEHVETALLGLNSLDDAIKLYRRARRECCDLMSAFEFMPPVAFTLAIEAIPDLKMPIAGDYPAYVLMEISGSGLVDTADLMGRFLEGVMEDGLVLDGVIASSRAQAQSLWLFREGMNEKLPECLAVSYGHVGDGNVHLNVLPPNGATPEERETFIYKSKTLVNDVLDRYVGSISAEHGIGRLKRSDFESRLSDVQRRMITGLKNAFDPDLRMNPGCQISLQPDS
jgi:FAD/FMN-containing dehydrogenase